MRCLRFAFIFVCVFFFLSTSEAVAQTRYVSDVLIVSLRDAPSNNYHSIKTLKTGTPVETISEEDGFYKVRTKDGLEGYIAKQYLTLDIPKPVIIKRLKADLDKALKRIDKLKSELTQEKDSLSDSLNAEEVKNAALLKQLNGARETLAKIKKDKAEIVARYETLVRDSGHIVDVINERDRLSSEVDALKNKVDALEEKNSALLRTGVIKWFLAGGGVLLIGWMIGRISRKHRSSLSY